MKDKIMKLIITLIMLPVTLAEDYTPDYTYVTITQAGWDSFWSSLQTIIPFIWLFLIFIGVLFLIKKLFD